MKKLPISKFLSKKTTSRKERSSRALRLESLESRELLSVAPGSDFLATDAALVGFESDSGARVVDVVDLADAAFDVGAEAAAPQAAKLSTPGNPRETAKTETTFSVAWDPVPNATGYRITWRDRDASANSFVTLDASTTSYKFTGLYNDSSYYWKIQAVGEGAYAASDYTKARVVEPRHKLNAPTFSSFDSDSTSISISWDAVPNASRYYVSYKLASATAWSGSINVGTSLDYTIGGLKKNVRYDVRVKAIGDNFDYGTSDYATKALKTQTPEARSTVVTTADDVVDYYDGETSLREALEYADSGATVTFVDALQGQTIKLDSQLGALTASERITIDASNLWNASKSAPGLTISGQRSTGILYVGEGADVEISGITLVNGYGFRADVDAMYDVGGGAVYNYRGTLLLNNCAICDNEAYCGGAVYSYGGKTALANCSVTSNYAYYGGAIYSYYGTLSLDNCVVSGNEAFEEGGGTCVYGGETTLVNCAVTDNFAYYVGGLELDGIATLYNCTVANNRAGEHVGGVELNWDCVFNAYNSIIVGNSALGEDDDLCFYEGEVNAYNTLSSFADWTNGSNNLTYNASKPLFKDAKAGDYTLAKGSQAINRGNNEYATTSVDLAGNPRINDGKVDLGAYEKPVVPIKLSSPGAPRATAKTETSITASWDAVPNASGYRFIWKNQSDSSYTTVALSASKTSYRFTGLDAGATYIWKVLAVGDGDSYLNSDYCATQRDKPRRQLPAPTGTVGVGSATSATVRWDAVPNAVRYAVSYKLASETTWSSDLNAGASLSYTIQGLARNTRYHVRVRAIGDGVDYKTSGYSATVRVKTTNPVQLDVPANPRATAKTATTITASWDAVPNATGYRFIWKNQSDASFSSPIILSASTTSYQMTGLDNNATYVWKVLALGDGVSYLNSAYCATQRDKPQQTLAAPILTVSVAPTSLTLDWAAVANVARYSVAYKPSSDSTWTNVNVGTNCGYTLADLPSGVQYDVRVKAVGDGVDYKSAYSSLVRTTTTSSSSSVFDDVDEFFDELDLEDYDLLARDVARA